MFFHLFLHQLHCNLLQKALSSSVFLLALAHAVIWLTLMYFWLGLVFLWNKYLHGHVCARGDVWEVVKGMEICCLS